MTGINYLTSNQVAIEWAPNITVFWAILAVIFIILVIAGIVVAFQEDNIIPFGLFVVTGLFIGTFFGSIGAEVASVPVQYETQYQVTITDEANIQEFLDKYEVVKQDGKIFTIREKDNREKP